MALKLYAVDTATNSCELVELTGYPKISSTDGTVTITPVVDPATGVTTWDLASSVDVNMDVVGFDPATMVMTLKETDGQEFTVDLSSLRSSVSGQANGHTIATHDDGNGNTFDIKETVTSVVVDGAGFKFIGEDGSATTISMCEMAANLPDNGNKIGG